jgi:Family of unknown function (DUF6169)
MIGYDYIFIGGEENVCVFDTDNSITYEVKFRDSSYIFDGYSTKQIEAYEMSIAIIDNLDAMRPPLDPQVAETIALIFSYFFNENHKQIVIYICDSSDNRQLARKRKFDRWINHFGDDFVKIDAEIIDKENVIYYTSIILHANNPHRSYITEIFYNLVVSQQK